MFEQLTDAFDRLLNLQSAVDRSMNSSFFDLSTTGSGYPPVNIFEENHNTLVTLELPGFKKKDISIEVQGNKFRIQGKKELEYPDQSSAHRLERRSQEFDRTITVKNKIDDKNVKAEFRDGVLTVLLPIQESEKPKQITVQ